MVHRCRLAAAAALERVEVEAAGHEVPILRGVAELAGAVHHPLARVRRVGLVLICSLQCERSAGEAEASLADREVRILLGVAVLAAEGPTCKKDAVVLPRRFGDAMGEGSLLEGVVSQVRNIFFFFINLTPSEK